MTAFTSADGTTWSSAGAVTLAATTVYVGLAVTAHNIYNSGANRLPLLDERAGRRRSESASSSTPAGVHGVDGDGCSMEVGSSGMTIQAIT